MSIWPIHDGELDGYDDEPTDAQLGGHVTDPYDAPSYDRMTNDRP